MSSLVLVVGIGLPLVLAAATVVWALFTPCKCERCRTRSPRTAYRVTDGVMNEMCELNDPAYKVVAETLTEPGREDIRVLHVVSPTASFVATPSVESLAYLLLEEVRKVDELTDEVLRLRDGEAVQSKKGKGK